MERPLRVVLVADALGIGGTEKGLVHHALTFDRDRVHPRVVTLKERGARAGQLDEAGIPVDCAEGDDTRLVGLLEGADVVHVFRSGTAERTVPAARRAAGVPVLVETNVFCSVDVSSDEREFDCHLLLSKGCARRYRREAGLTGPEFHDRHRVLFLPVWIERLRELAPERAQAKAELGLDPDRPVVGRIGRASDRNWRDLIVDMVPLLLEEVPEAQVMIVGITPGRRRRLARKGLGGRVTLLEPTLDERRLAAMFSACDVFVTAAELGESYSVAISEAMALGLPVVTCSTPWHNNGQLERVDNGVTGFVANHPKPFAEAVALLLGDPVLRAEFASRSRANADRLLDVHPLTRQLEDLYAALVDGEGPPADWVPSPGEVDDFEADYERRLNAEFRPLTARERVEAYEARVRERTKWAGRALRKLNAQNVALGLWSLRAKLAPRRR